MYVQMLKQSCSPLGVLSEGSRHTIPDSIARQWIQDGVAQEINPARIKMEETTGAVTESPVAPSPTTGKAGDGADALPVESPLGQSPRRR